MPAGGELKVKAQAQAQGAEVLFVDTGAGIPADVLSKIFEPLFTTKPKGTGLGLSICQGIIEGHRGRLEVESEVGRGTTFRVVLPG